MKTKIWLVAALLLLTGCGSKIPPSEPGGVKTEAPPDVQLYVFDVKVRDGRAECIVWSNRVGGGMDCRWPREGE